MAFTKVVGPGIHTQSQLRTHNIHSSGIITATKFIGPLEASSGSSGTFDSLTVTGNVSVGGTLQYEDVINVESVGIITAKAGLNVSSGTATFAGNINANGNIVGDNSTDISGINDITASMLSISDTITHTGDTNTKIRFPNPDTFTVETGGTERLRIGSIGISTFTNSIVISEDNAIHFRGATDSDKDEANLMQLELKTHRLQQYHLM